MKSMKGRFLNRLKLTPTITAMKHALISHHTLQIPSVYNCEKEKTTPPIVLCMDKEEEEVVEEEESHYSLSDFEEKLPPGGSDSIILYTTSLRGIRKTFEDCHTIMFLLESFKVNFHVRDVSMDMEFREELWKTMGGRVIPPRLFIKGRYIGGADEVISLHEQGKLKNLLQGIPKKLSNLPCVSCSNQRFLVCFTCNGCRKLFVDHGETDHQDQFFIMRCRDCNENGLVKCSVCI